MLVKTLQYPAFLPRLCTELFPERHKIFSVTLHFKKPVLYHSPKAFKVLFMLFCFVVVVVVFLNQWLANSNSLISNCCDYVNKVVVCMCRADY